MHSEAINFERCLYAVVYLCLSDFLNTFGQSATRANAFQITNTHKQTIISQSVKSIFVFFFIHFFVVFLLSLFCTKYNAIIKWILWKYWKLSLSIQWRPTLHRIEIQNHFFFVLSILCAFYSLAECNSSHSISTQMKYFI